MSCSHLLRPQGHNFLHSRPIGSSKYVFCCSCTNYSSVGDQPVEQAKSCLLLVFLVMTTTDLKGLYILYQTKYCPFLSLMLMFKCIRVSDLSIVKCLNGLRCTGDLPQKVNPIFQGFHVLLNTISSQTEGCESDTPDTDKQHVGAHKLVEHHAHVVYIVVASPIRTWRQWQNCCNIDYCFCSP